MRLGKISKAIAGMAIGLASICGAAYANTEQSTSSTTGMTSGFTSKSGATTSTSIKS